MARYALRFGGAVLLPTPSSLPPANMTLYVRGKGAPNAAKVNAVSIDYFSPVFVGDTANPLCIQVLHADRSIVNIAGAAISMEMQSATNPAIIKICTGQWVVSSENDGKAAYYYRAQDVDTVDLWKLWMRIFLAEKPLHPDDGAGNLKVLEVKALPSGA